MPVSQDVLGSVPLFQLLDEEELRDLSRLLDEASFGGGQPVFRAGDPGGAMYVVLDGEVEVFVDDHDGQRVVLDRAGRGDFFGELSLLDGHPRSAGATAVSPTRAFVVRRQALEQLFTRRPHAALDILTMLAGRIRRTDDLLRQRVARNANEVLEETETFGERVADGVARFGGSWSFIFSFGAILLAWVGINTVLLLGREPFDPYPFILLNLFLSMLAALQAPVIMMSQNRQDAKDRVRSELDYQVNLKAELEIMQLHEKVDRIEARLGGQA